MYPVSGLRIQIYAALNPGNSGGPVVSGDRMVGLAFGGISSAQNTGYIIPNEEIELFLADIADGSHEGKPQFYDEVAPIENAALRAYLGLEPKTGGLVVRATENPTPGYPLRKWDVITHIGGVPLDNEGRSRGPDNQRFSFRYLIQQKQANALVAMTVLRAGKPLELKVPLEYGRPRLIPYLGGRFPSWFIYGPVVFSMASEEFVQAYTGGSGSSGASSNAGLVYGTLSAQGNPLVTRRNERAAGPDQHLVIIPAPLFPHRTSKGFGSQTGRVVESVNGTPVTSISHLVQLLRDSREEHIVIEFAGRGGDTLVLPRKEMATATEEILTDNGIRSQGSPELLKIWGGSKAAD
jgi:S1-C subfamily serine protease